MVALDQLSWLFKLELLMRGIRVHPDGWGLRPGQKAPLPGANTLAGTMYFDGMVLPAPLWNMTSGLNKCT